MYMYIQLSWNIFYILQSSDIKHFHMCIHSITDLKSILTGSRAKFSKLLYNTFTSATEGNMIWYWFRVYIFQA